MSELLLSRGSVLERLLYYRHIRLEEPELGWE